MTETNRRAASTGPAVSDDDVHVLLVDDNETWVASTAQILEHQREAFSVRTATDIDAATAVFAANDPDCVVSDYQLDQGNGLDLLTEIREQSPDRPFILITGRGDETLASDAIGKQVTDYIPKRSLSGRDDLLARRVEAAVDAYRTRQALARERRSKESMLDILTATSSRDGLVHEFCDHLVRDQGYDCAWIGITDPSRGLVPKAAAGAEQYLDEAIRSGAALQEGTEPALVALERQGLHVVAPIGTTAARDAGKGDEWRTAAADHGFTSAAAVPIEHEGTVFGVIAVYTARAGIDAGERGLLEEYSETIGYALRSAEWRESLLSTTPVAVEVELTDQSVPLVALGNHLSGDVRIQVLTAVVREETFLYVTRITGATAGEVRDSVEAVDSVERATVDRNGDRLRCEVVVSPPTPETVLAEHGGRITDACVEHGRASITVASPGDNVQSVTAAVQSEYPDAGVRSVRSSGEVPRSTTTADLRESLTDKQQQALELAFYEGYFERPREHNTTEVADKLGVSRPTFTQHLRAAERKLFGRLLEE